MKTLNIFRNHFFFYLFEYAVEKCVISFKYILKQWIVFFAVSDWLLKLGKFSAIHHRATITSKMSFRFAAVNSVWQVLTRNALSV